MVKPLPERKRSSSHMRIRSMADFSRFYETDRPQTSRAERKDIRCFKSFDGTLDKPIAKDGYTSRHRRRKEKKASQIAPKKNKEATVKEMTEKTKKLSNTFRAKMDSLMPGAPHSTAKSGINFIKSILYFHHTQMTPVLKNCRETLTGQVSMIMKLLEMQVKYGLNVVNAEDEVTGKFDPEKVCDLQQ